MKHSTTHTLRQFFSGYFHEDWEQDSDNPGQVVKLFNDQNSVEKRREVADAINALLEEAATEEALASAVLEDFGCYYDPAADGSSMGDWLRAIRTVLV